MPVLLRPFDPARHIETPEDVFYFLEAAMEGNDPKHIARALGDVVRSKGMEEISKRTGTKPQAIGAALTKDGNLTLETLIEVVKALGLELTVQKRAA
jgi:probable addiction module antidote protein